VRTARARPPRTPDLSHGRPLLVSSSTAPSRGPAGGRAAGSAPVRRALAPAPGRGHRDPAGVTRTTLCGHRATCVQRGPPSRSALLGRVQLQVVALGVLERRDPAPRVVTDPAGELDPGTAEPLDLLVDAPEIGRAHV